jgi:hypothetical protein
MPLRFSHRQCNIIGYNVDWKVVVETCRIITDSSQLCLKLAATAGPPPTSIAKMTTSPLCLLVFSLYMRQVEAFAYVGAEPIPTTRVGNRISYEKNSMEWTRIGFRYSAEESAHSDFLRRANSEAGNGMERNGTEFHGKN